MAAALTPIPGTSPPPQADLNTLLGPQQTQPSPPTTDPQGIARSVMTQTRDLLAGLENFVRQFPDVQGLGELAVQAKQLIVAMMMKAVGSQSSTESGPPPPVLG